MLSGLDTAQARAGEAEAVTNWAFRQFAQTELGKAGTHIAKADVSIGSEKTVGLELGEDLSLLLPVNPIEPLKTEIVYNGPIKAPIAKGDVIGELIISPDGLPEKRVPLLADRDVLRHGFVGRLVAAAQHVVARINSGPAPEAS